VHPSLVPARPGDAILDEEEDPDSASGPHKLILVTAVGMTDTGLRRKHNEDAYVCLDEHNLYAIADGMGMHAAGEVAAKLTIEAITEVFTRGLLLDDEDARRAGRSRRKRLVRTIERANDMVLAMSKEVDAYHGMGTTVVIAQFSPAKARVHIAHVGDSRCYRLRGDEIKQLTTDHTLGAVGIRGKTEGVLSRAVGIEPHVEVDVTVDHPEVGDIYLLCSDGLSRMTTDDKILEAVRACGSNLDEAARALIALANAGGGRDNVTTILVRVDAAPASQ
jgi:protein phosphatase